VKNTTAQFKDYLLARGASRVTVKNYLSDWSHFCGWYEFYLRQRGREENEVGFLTSLSWRTVEKYKEFLVANRVAAATVNRRLATLRRWGEMAVRERWIEHNSAIEVTNVTKQTGIEEVLAKFEKHLRGEKLAEATLKNYMSDTRQFLNWAEVAY